jgi:hypothetical protein
MSELYQSLSHSKWDCKYHVNEDILSLRRVLYWRLPFLAGCHFLAVPCKTRMKCSGLRGIATCRENFKLRM